MHVQQQLQGEMVVDCKIVTPKRSNTARIVQNKNKQQAIKKQKQNTEMTLLVTSMPLVKTENNRP